MIIELLRTMLQEDPEIGASLGRWTFDGEGKKPAVFDFDPAPSTCPNPVAVLLLDNTRDWEGTRAGEGLVWSVNCRLWGDRVGRGRDLRRLAGLVAERIRAARGQVVDGRKIMLVKITSMQHIKDDEEFPGVNLQAEIHAL